MSMCYHPFFAANPTPSYGKEKIAVPCGKCPPCLQRRAAFWSFRLSQNMKGYKSMYFLTLTYRDAPITHNGFMTLVKRDFQLFMKRLRRFHPKGTKISYYACGEYGSKRFRPHYHAIIFGINPDYIEKAWSDKFIDDEFDRKTLQLAGVPGIYEADPDVNEANIAYVTKYITKGKQIPKHAKDDRLPEFALMSKNMGKQYLTPEMVKYHQQDITRMFHTLPDGIKVPMSRYYRERIYSDSQRLEYSKIVQQKMSELFEDKKTEFAKNYPDDHFERSYSETVKANEKILFNNALDRGDP